ncbi:MAG: VOC family protein [Bradyrhizobium sp.]|nr:MAG: VOC family protein [Bradyrhizobium sp.]
MLDHIGFSVRNLAVSRKFYLSALAPLGLGIVMEGPYGVGFGRGHKPAFWLSEGEAPTSPLHVAFAVETRAEVDAFHAAALAAGGKDNGGPGLRHHYHPTYYGAFAIDPDGHNIEAVCHRAEP